MSVFKLLHSGQQTSSNVDPLVFGTTGKSASMLSYFTNIQVYDNTVTGEVTYHPLQAKHHCFINSNHGTMCRMKTAKYDYTKPTGYGGLTGHNPPGCSGNFKAIGNMCILLPVNAADTYAKAKTDCLNQGGTLYAPKDPLQNTIIAAKLKEWNVNELWVDVVKKDGLWKNGRKPADAFNTDWVDGEPLDVPGAECSFLHRLSGYQMKTDNCKASKQYLCTALVPNCPQGFEHFAPYKAGLSCFKVVTPGSTNFAVDDIYSYGDNDINIVNKECLDLRTSPASPTSLDDADALVQWKNRLYGYIFGVIGYQSNPAVTGQFITRHSDQLVNITDLAAYPGECGAAYTGLYYTGLCKQTFYYASFCEYTECSTVDGKFCEFPFKYKNRLYDTCITHDDKGENPGDYWCPTAVDFETRGSISGSEASCSDLCEKRSNCPIGFWPMYGEPTCYQDSAGRVKDMIETFDEGEEICRSQGARLMQIRSTEALNHLTLSRPSHFAATTAYVTDVPDTVVGIGMKYQQLDDDDEKILYYWDNTKVDEKLADKMIADHMHADFPSADPDTDCLAFKGDKLLNVPCEGFFNGTGDGSTAKGLAYMCEAKPLTALDSNQACIFPFKYQGITYSSCSIKPVPGFNPLGRAWCPTEVDGDQNVIRDKWILCNDERAIIYDGSGAGYTCPLPFIYDRVYYDDCTRLPHDGSPGFASYYWCPDQKYLLPNNEYNQSAPIGKCPDFLKPPGKRNLQQSLETMHNSFQIMDALTIMSQYQSLSV